MKKIKAAVKSCDQIKGQQTVYQHSLSVFKYALSIRRSLASSQIDSAVQIPPWMMEYREFILSHLVDHKTLKHYCLWHDVGKPFCKPDH